MTNEASRARPEQERFIAEAGENRITKVVVFDHGAYLQRRVQTQVHGGLNRILIEVKAFQIDSASVQARVYGQGDILSVQFKETPVKDAPQEDVRALDEDKRARSRERGSLERERDVVDKQIAFLDSVVAFSETETPKELKTEFPDVERLQGTLEFLDANYRRLAQRREELGYQVDELDREIAVLERRLKRLRRSKSTTRKCIEVLFDATEEQALDIEASYVASNASWKPVYKVDVPLDLESVSLTMFARIEQATGENWDDVDLSVSNALPMKGTALPDPQGWHLQLPHVMVAAEAAPDVVFDDMAAGGAEEEFVGDLELSEFLDDAPEAAFLVAKAQQLPLAFEYDLPQKVDIGSGDGATLLPLYAKTLEGEFFHFAVPRLDPLAYLVCSAGTDSALLAGRLNIHLGGRFIGSTALAEKRAGEELLINLGADRGVKVHREKVTDKLTETFFGMVDRSSVARALEFRVVVENLKDQPVRMRVADSVPVSNTDRIQIKGLEMVPEPEVRDWKQREGVTLWDFEADAGSTREISVKFFVKHPKDMLPDGL